MLFFLLIIQNAWATMDASYQEGSTYANTLQEGAKASLPQSDLKEVTGFQSENPSESSLYDTKNFNDAVSQSLDQSEAGKMIVETAKSRNRFEINPETDPLFQVDSKESAEQTLNIQNVHTEVKKEGVIKKTCEEGGEEITHECFENRHVVPIVPLKTATININHSLIIPRMISYTVQTKKGGFFSHSASETRQRQEGYTLTLPKDIKEFKEAFCPGFNPRDIKTNQVFNVDCSKIQSYTIQEAAYTYTVPARKGLLRFLMRRLCSFSVSDSGTYLTITAPENYINITLNHKTFEGEEIDEWHSTCDFFENLVDEGLCQYGERTLTQGLETRNIDGYSITKDAWQYKQVYHCKMIKDDCAPLRSQGCYQVSSKCKEKREEKCWIYEQQYECPDGRLAGAKIKSPASEAFCLTGDCHNASYQANGDMLEVISRLSMLKEIQNDMQMQGNNFHIFKGRDHQCSRNCINFKDCCGGLKGWGVSLHIAGCTPEEKELAKMREKSLCHQIGTYCAKKILKKCVSKKTSFCCFGSKFARLLQEQGRAQLGLGWGNEKCPNCRGLTVEELSRMDLSKMDFRELFDDVIKKYKQPDLKALQETASKNINQNVQRIEQGIKQKKTLPKTGVLDERKNGL